MSVIVRATWLPQVPRGLSRTSYEFGTYLSNAAKKSTLSNLIDAQLSWIAESGLVGFNLYALMRNLVHFDMCKDSTIYQTMTRKSLVAPTGHFVKYIVHDHVEGSTSQTCLQDTVYRTRVECKLEQTKNSSQPYHLSLPSFSPSTKAVKSLRHIRTCLVPKVGFISDNALSLLTQDESSSGPSSIQSLRSISVLLSFNERFRTALS